MTTEADIRRSEASREQHQQPSIPDEDTTDDADDGGGGSLLGFEFGLSRRTLLLIGVAVVAALVLYRMRQQGCPGQSEAAKEVERALSDDLTSEYETDRDEDGSIHIPVNPSDELAKDAAVLDGLKERGKFGAAS